MEPIINPWVFYLMDICWPISFFSGLIAIVAFIGWVITFVLSKIEQIDCGETLDYKILNKAAKSLLPVAIISAFISIATPSESAITKMIVAQNATYERVEMVGETVQDVYEDIISLVDGDKEEEE